MYVLLSRVERTRQHRKTHLANPLLSDQNVRRLQIAVHDRNRERVHVRQRTRASPQDLEADRVREPVLLVRRAEITVGAELKDDADLARLLDLEECQDPDDVRVSELENELNLLDSLIRLEQAKQLYRNRLIQVLSPKNVCGGALWDVC